MHIDEIIAKIEATDSSCAKLAQARFDALIKPVGSLAKLEIMISRYCGIVEKYDKAELDYPPRSIFVWCDLKHCHEAALILQGQLPVNALAQEVAASAHAFVVTAETEEEALEEGITLVQEMVQKGRLGLVAFGAIADVKNKCLMAAVKGGILAACAMKLPIILDGLVASVAAREAVKLNPHVAEYLFAGHVAAEPGAEAVLQELKLDAPLRLDIPDGAGEGAAMAISLFDAGLKTYREMETFEEAGVHDEMKEYSRKEETKGAHWQQ